jgi:hypothetical protein
MVEAELIGASLQRGSRIGYGDEVLTGLVLASQRADAVEEIVQENIGFQRAAGLGGDDEQRLAEVDRLLDRLDLGGVGAVQHVEMRPARLPLEGLAQHLRPQARTAHSQ